MTKRKAIGDWDNELAAIGRELERVRAVHKRSRLDGRRSLIASKVGIVQSQIHLERTIERIKNLTGREHLLLPRERALMHWATIYCESLERFHSERSQLLSRGMWLKLIKTRLAGPSSRDRQDKTKDPEQSLANELEAEDLVDLAVRQANLNKTESLLADALVKLKSRRLELMRQYEHFVVAGANKAAGGCLYARLGANIDEALRSPSMKALGEYLLGLVAPLQKNASPVRQNRERHLEAREQKFADKSSTALDLCKKLVLRKLKQPDRHPSRKVLSRFQHAMQQLNDLEAQTRRAYDEIRSFDPGPDNIVAPIQVQKP